MTKSLALPDGEAVHALAEEITTILAHCRVTVTVEMIAMKYRMGEAIATNPLYKKHGKSQSELYEAIAGQSGTQPGTLADCVKLYESAPGKRPESVAEKLYTTHGSWRNVRVALYGGDPNARTEQEKKQRQERCRQCPIHC